MIKKIFILLSVFMLFCISGCQKQKQEIYVFYTSDVHCGVEDNLGLASVKSLVDEKKAENKNVLLVDLGDFIQGANLGSMTKGESIIEIMNAMNYDYVTFGNHEFDYDMDHLKKLESQVKFQFVISNAKYTGNKESVFEDLPEYVIHDFNGTKIGFIGILTPLTLTTSTPAFFKEDGKFVYDFYSGNNGQELYDKVQGVVDELRKQKVDYVVALSHLGSTESYRPFDSISLIANTSGIDVVLDGHSHSVIIGDAYPNKEGKDVILSSVGTKMENLGELIIDMDGKISIALISAYDKQDQGILDVIEKEKDKLNVILSKEVCEVDFDLPMNDKDGVRLSRSRETTIGNFMTDAVRNHFESDIAIINAGSIRKGIQSGKVTYETLVDVNPFGDPMVMIKARGQMILDALEFGAQATDAITALDGNAVGEYGGMVVASGLKYTINTNIKSTITLDQNNLMTGVGENRRISDVKVLQNGEYVDLDPEAYYTISGCDYILLQNGDGNTAFDDAELVEASTYTFTDVMVEYIEENNGIPEQYRNLEGRIIVR